LGKFASVLSLVMLFRFRVYGAVVVNHGGFFVFCNKTRSNISLLFEAAQRFSGLHSGCRLCLHRIMQV